MGGNSSKEVKFIGQFIITCEKNFYYPGEQINMKIYIKSELPLKNGLLTFELIQNEFWKGTKISPILKSKETQNDINTTKIFSQTLQFNQLINNPLLSKGIEIPFTIQSPNYMLPSLEYLIIDQLAYIRTNLLVKINEINLEKNVFLMINKPISPLSSPLKFSVQLGKIFGFFGSNNGIIEVSYPTNNYSFYSFIPLNFHVDISNEKIISITTRLVRKISFIHQGKKEGDIILKEDLVKIDTDIKNKISDFNLNIQIKEPESIFNKYVMNYTGIRVPSKDQLIYLIPSVESNIIKVEYYIKIRPNYDTIIDLKKTELKLPLSISHQSINDSNNMNNHLENFLNNEINRINSMPMDPNVFNQLPDMNTVLGENQNINQPNINMSNQQNINMSNQPNINMSNQPNNNMNYQPNINMSNQQNINMNYQPNNNMNYQPNNNMNNQPNNNMNNQPNNNMNNQPNNNLNNQQNIPSDNFNYPQL